MDVKIVVRRLMNWSCSKVLAWCIPLAIVVAAIVCITIFGNKDVISLLINIGVASGSYVVGRASKS